MPMRFRTLAMLCLGLLLVASCGTTPPTANPTTPPTVAPPSTVPATAVPATATSLPPTLVASPSPVPTAIPTPIPTVTPAPLAAGWWDSAVCYEVFVRSFYDSDGDGIGDINGLITKLDYINDGNPNNQTDLGANCIWLMPIAESTSYHGYDVVDYYTVERDYGSNDDFKRFMAEARQRGIKVVIDLVLNHTGVDHPWFQDALSNPDSPYRDWYIWSEDDPGYGGPWGQQVWHQSPLGNEYYYGVFWGGMPDLNYRNPEVTAEAQKISRFWIEEMGVDGFRLDAVKHLIEEDRLQENTNATHEWLRQYYAFLQETAPGFYTIGEIFDGNPENLAPYYPDQLDMYFAFEIGKQIIASAHSQNTRLYTLAIQRMYSKIPSQRWAPFLTNHDQNRVMTELVNNTPKAKIAALALLTLPGMPYLYYGEEIGMLGGKPDEQIRTPMQWTAEEGGGFTVGQPWQPFQRNYAQVNVATQDADPDSLLNLYRQLVHLHTAQPALARGDLTVLASSNAAVAAFLRQVDDEAILVVLNFGDKPLDQVALTVAQSGLAAGRYTLESLLGSADATPLTVEAGGALTNYVPLPSLAPRTGYIFKLQRDN